MEHYVFRNVFTYICVCNKNFNEKVAMYFQKSKKVHRMVFRKEIESLNVIIM